MTQDGKSHRNFFDLPGSPVVNRELQRVAYDASRALDLSKLLCWDGIVGRNLFSRLLFHTVLFPVVFCRSRHRLRGWPKRIGQANAVCRK